MTKAQEEGFKLMISHDIQPKPDYRRMYLLDLENEAASLDEEAAEIEQKFEAIATRANKVKQAIAALKALEEVKA